MNVLERAEQILELGAHLLLLFFWCQGARMRRLLISFAAF